MPGSRAHNRDGAIVHVGDRTMKNENQQTTELQPEVPDTSVEKQPEPEGKLLLGKRVLRHFGVRSDVQAGTYSGESRRP